MTGSIRCRSFHPAENCFLDYSAIRLLAFASNCFCNLAAHYGVSEVTGSIRCRSFHPAENCFLDYSAIRLLAFASNCFCNLAAHYGVSEVTGSIRSRSFHPAENPKKKTISRSLKINRKKGKEIFFEILFCCEFYNFAGLSAGF